MDKNNVPTAEDYSDFIRELCCQLAVGGWNSEGLMPIETARAKINDGIDDLVRGAARAAPGVPAGWKLVPLDADTNMLMAGGDLRI